MQFSCTITQLATGGWKVRHDGPSVGSVEVTAPSRQEALNKIRREIF